MSSQNLRVFLSEITLASCITQILFGSVIDTYAVNPQIYETIQTHSATTGYSFTMSGTTYLAIGDGNSSSGAEIRTVSSTGASTLIQNFPDNAEAFQYFSIGNESYLAVGNRTSNDEIYRFDGTSFTGFQTLPADILASDFAFINQSGSYLLAASNNSSTSPSQVFQWTGTGFEFSYNLGELTSHSAIESFQIRDLARESYPYAQMMVDNSIIANQTSFTGYRLEDTMTKAELAKLAATLAGISPTSCVGNIYSDVNTPLGDLCGYIEALAEIGIIPTTSATFSPLATIDRGEAVGMVAKAMGESPIISLPSFADNYGHPDAGYVDRIQELGCTDAGRYFYTFEKAKRGDVFKFALCIAGLDASSIAPLAQTQYEGSYFALSDGRIYKTNSTGASLVQSLPINGPTDIKFMNIRGDQIIGFLDHGSMGLLLYKWDGTQFVQFQQIQLSTSGGNKLSFDAFTSDAGISDGKSYIILPLGFANKSGLYVYQDGQFELAQYIANTNLGTSDIHTDWKYFVVDGIPFLFLVNSSNTTNSAIFNYLPPPYVVVKSPISGESSNYREWNPNSTPITGIGSPTTHIMVYDGAGTNIGSGVVSYSGTFSILASANSGNILPIRVVPYTYILGEEKTIDYVYIPEPAPTPTSSHDSKVYRDSFIFSISGATSFYTVSGEDKIQYEVYKNNNFSVSGEVSGYGVDIAVTGEDTSIRYFGKNNSGATTAVQIRDFAYDNTAPSASVWVYNTIDTSWGLDAFLPAGLEIRNSITQGRFSKLYSYASQKIGGFSLIAHQSTIGIQNITIQANISGTGVTLQNIAVNTGSVQLIDEETNMQVPATASISGNTLSFSGINTGISSGTTKSYGVRLDTVDLQDYYGRTLTLDSPIITSVFDSNNQPVSVTGSAISKTYTLSVVPPTVTITAVNENVFRVRVTNPDSNTGITITAANFDFKTALPANTSFTATACLRDLGSTSTCGGIDTSADIGIVPGSAQTFSMSGLTTNMIADKNNGTVEFEIYVTSTNLLPTGGQIQVALTRLDYSVGASADFETYYGTSGACSIYDKGAGAIQCLSQIPSLPTITEEPSVLFFITGSTAMLSMSHYDNTANFSATGINLLMPTPPVLSSGLIGNFFSGIGIYGVGSEITGDLSLSGGRRDIQYSLTDLVDNKTNKKFSLYRLPDLSQASITHTGGIAYYRFSSDMSAPVEYSYTQGVTTYSGTIQAMSGSNTITLTGTSLTGSILCEVRIAKNLPDIIVPDSVQEATKQTAAYSFDIYPDVFTFTKKFGVQPGAQVQFGPMTLTGFNVPTSIRTTRGSLDVDGQLYGTASTIVYPGSVVSIYVQAPSTYNAISSGTLIIGSGTSVLFEIENALAPVLIVIPPGPGGGGGGGSSSQGTSTSSPGQSTAANSSNPLYQGLLIMNPFLQKTLRILEPVSSMSPKIEIPIAGTSIRDIVGIAYKNLVTPVLQDALAKKTVSESIDRVDRGVKEYSLKMKESTINSPEYKTYRAARKELFSVRKEFVKNL